MQEISLNILDVAQNSVTAGAKLITITVDEQLASDSLTVVIADDGCGMSAETVKKVTDPFYTSRTTRKVGLGIPFFKMSAEMTGGSFDISSEVGRGTRVTARYVLDSIDRMPLGDINGTIQALITCNPSLDFVYLRRVDDREFTLDTRSMREILGDIPFDRPEVTGVVTDFLSENEQEVSGGASNS